MSNNKTFKLPTKTVFNGCLVWLACTCGLIFITVISYLTITNCFNQLQAGEALSNELPYFIAIALYLIVSYWLISMTIICTPLSFFWIPQNFRRRQYKKIDNLITHLLAFSNALHFELCPFNHPLLFALRMNQGTVRLMLGQYESAEEINKYLLSKWSHYKFLPKALSLHFVVQNNLSIACLKQEKYAEAELYAKQSLENAKKLPKQFESLIAIPLLTLGALKGELLELHSAQEYCLSALEAYSHMSDSPEQLFNTNRLNGTCRTNINLAGIAIAKKNIEESLKYFGVAINIINNDPTTIDAGSIKALTFLANNYIEFGKFTQAESILIPIYDIARLVPDHPDVPKLLDCYEKLLTITNRKNEIEKMRNL